MIAIRQSFIKLFAFIFCVTLSTFNLAFAGTTSAAIPDSAFAAANSNQPTPLVIPPPPNVNANGYVLMDADTGQIIASKNMYQRMPPASLTKMMTLYIISTALKNGQIHLTDLVHISKNAWQTGGSRMFIQPNTDVSVEDLVQGIIVDSGNDATVAMAEFLAGSEDSFVPLMNAQAKRLGMNNTNYTDANGLPHPDHYTCPHDIAILARHLIYDFPQYYHWYSQKYFTYNNIKQPNRNRLLWQDPSVDGIKTGHTQAAGYCLVTSAKRNGMRLISVIMGAPTDYYRASDNEALLNYGFRFYKTTTVYKSDSPVTQAQTWFGENKTTPIGVAKDLTVTLPVGQFKNLKANITLPDDIDAPVAKGQVIGSMTLLLNNKVLATKPLVALQANPKGGIFSRLADHLTLAFKNMFKKRN